MKIPFTKMCAIGNDFVVIDGTKQKHNLTKKNIQAISDRHFGIGCDQVLLIEHAKSKKVNSDNPIDFFITIFNADGTLAEQCGNGMRCIARYIFENNLSPKKKLTFATFARNIQAQLENDNNIKVNMGYPAFEPKLIPFNASQKQLKYNNIANIEIGVVSVGNPHVVILVDNVKKAPVDTLGKMISLHSDFPNGVNVNFMQIISRTHIKLRVYERGTGETLACGSGACASLAIGRLWDLLDKKIEAELTGGKLKVSWKNSNDPIFLTGPATTVFKGEI